MTKKRKKTEVRIVGGDNIADKYGPAAIEKKKRRAIKVVGGGLPGHGKRR